MQKLILFFCFLINILHSYAIHSTPTDLGDNSIIKLPTLFSDNMVLQRDKPIALWGEILPGEDVEIVFNGFTYNTTCDVHGRFRITLPALPASGNSYTMIFSSNNETKRVENIVMGDVYLCSGQSNMTMKISSILPEQIEDARADGTYPNLRYFNVGKIVSGGVLVKGKDKSWESALPERVTNWSAIAFFACREIHKSQNIPIGIIDCSHGGSPADAFISPEAYAANPQLNAAKRPNEVGIHQYNRSPSVLFISMVKKLVPYSLKAILWYQAEANYLYLNNFYTIMGGLIDDWRNQWKEELPFLFVQLPIYNVSSDITNMGWAELRNIQMRIWQDKPNMGMAVAMEYGTPTDIHPKNKKPVAERLARCISGLVYEEDIQYKSPIYKKHWVQGNKVIVAFDNIGGGLTSLKAITEFEIAGSNGEYKYAKATIVDGKLAEVTAETISDPKYVRYAFRNNSTISIYTNDEAALPLSPFRSGEPSKKP